MLGHAKIMMEMSRVIYLLRAKLDKNKRLQNFVQKLEVACIVAAESGKMTKDLAILIHGLNVSREYYLNTAEFIGAVATNLEAKLGEPTMVTTMINYRTENHRTEAQLLRAVIA